jgi:hypothetical protein
MDILARIEGGKPNISFQITVCLTVKGNKQMVTGSGGTGCGNVYFSLREWRIHSGCWFNREGQNIVYRGDKGGSAPPLSKVSQSRYINTLCISRSFRSSPSIQ